MAGSPRFVGYSTTALRCPDEENATDDILLTDTNPIQGRTHDRNRPTRQISHLFSCTQGAVHTCTKARAGRSSGHTGLSDRNSRSAHGAPIMRRPERSPILALRSSDSTLSCDRLSPPPLRGRLHRRPDADG